MNWALISARTWMRWGSRSRGSGAVVSASAAAMEKRTARRSKAARGRPCGGARVGEFEEGGDGGAERLGVFGGSLYGFAYGLLPGLAVDG